MALGPGPAGLKFWTPQGLTADNATDATDLPAGAVNWFNPWGPKRPVQDWVSGSPSYLIAPVTPPDTTNLPAGGANWFNPWGPRQPERSWRQPGIQFVPEVLTAASGSYTLTGTAAALAFGHVAGSGSYSITGSAVALALGHVAGAGSYTLTGAAAALAFGHAAGSGSYTLTGSAAALALGHVAGAGSYTLTGAAAGLTVAVNYTAAAGSYTLTGSSATFAFGHVAGAGTYTLTGSAAGLVIPGAVDYLPAGMTGSYVPWRRPYPTSLLTRTGRPLAVGPVALTAAGGSYTITGTAALFTVVTPADTTNLPAGATSWFNPWRRQYPVALRSWTVQPIIVGPVVLTAAAGSYTLTGSDVTFVGITPPVEPPIVTTPPGGVGTGVRRVGRYRQLKLRKKLKRDECEELLEYLRSLPPAERQEEIEQLASRPWIASLLEMMPAAAPMQISAKPVEDDDDEECIELLLELLNNA